MTASRDLCIMACTFCRDRDFWHWMAALDPARVDRFDEAGAKAFVLSMCRVSSRSQLDTDPVAAQRFHTLVRTPFLEWKAAQSSTPSWIDQ